jgi:hypothetical protein
MKPRHRLFATVQAFQYRKKIADKIKMTHLALVETKTVGNSDFRDRERNRVGVKRQQRIPLEAPRSFLDKDKDRTLVLGAD